ncbi:MAG: ATP-dependent DNA helicase RuvA [Gemmataceae bacterium]|nr:ATP-dependent DNA helicase RuvA [Gemmataceae bacterium]
MITRIQGVLTAVLEDEIRLQVGPLEYQVLVPEVVRRAVQSQVGEQISFVTLHFFEGNPVQQGRMIPRLLGFLNQVDLAFFELFCTVDGIGIRKCMRMMVAPVATIADAIQRGDAKWLVTLPGIGPAMADKILGSLKKKAGVFAIPATNGQAPTQDPGKEKLYGEVLAGLQGLGLGPAEARSRLDRLLASGLFPDTVEKAITLMFKT